MAFYPYPTEFPTDALPLVIDALRGRAVDKKEVVHAVWHVAGYGLSKWDVHPPLIGAAVLSDEAAADALQAAVLVQGGEAQAALPWNLLIPVLVALLQRWLK